LFLFFIVLPIGIGIVFLAVMIGGVAISSFSQARSESLAKSEQAERDKIRAQVAAIDGDTAKANREAEEKAEQLRKEAEEYDRQLKQQIAESKARHEQEQAEAEVKAAAEQTARIRAAKLARDAKLLAYQLSQASNGLPSFQLIIGKRYLTGEGVETNLDLAKHWLRSAMTNGETQATTLLSKLP